MSDNNYGKSIVAKLTIVYIAVVVFAMVIILRVLYLQIAEHEKWSNTNKISTKDIIIEPSRGNILATDGRILATSIPFYEIRMDLKCPALTDQIFNSNIDLLCRKLANLFGDKTALQYKRQLVSARYRGARYHLIRRKVDYIQLKKLKEFPIFEKGQYKGGFIVMQENKRIQPFVSLASRTIGYQSKGGTIVGIEGAYDAELKGKKGLRLVQRIAGNYWMPVKDGREVEPRNGYDVITSIDINFQDVAHQALYTQLSRHNASHGTAILMEVGTGDIKAIVNLKRDSQGQYSERYNYAIGERTEPGSTFKLPSLMVALEDGFIDLNDSIDTGKGKVYYHDHLVKDSKEGGHGKITVKQVFEVSSNVGVTKIVTQYYGGNEERFVKGLKRMGLTDRFSLEIKGERSPYIKFPNDTLWSGISLPQMSYGYEVEQTPLQILAFYNAIANDGEMLKPRFVKAISNHGEIVKEIKPKVINPSICSKATISKAKLMLEGVVENGTAQNLKNSNYTIAGKTGTAQIANRKYGYKGKVSYQASFVGYFPADNPAYSCIVVVNAPSNGVYYGNTVAGTVFREISDKVYSTQIDLYGNETIVDDFAVSIPYSRKGYKKDLESVLKNLHIPYESLGVNSDWVATEKRDSTIRFYNRYIKDRVVPDVKGMGAKDAMFVLENLGLNVVIQGRGSVSTQSISPGTRFRQGDRVVLELNS